jgi:hypothetical protein
MKAFSSKSIKSTGEEQFVEHHHHHHQTREWIIQVDKGRTMSEREKERNVLIPDSHVFSRIKVSLKVPVVPVPRTMSIH